MNKISRLILLTLTLIMTIIGGTFAWLTYQSKKSSLVLNIGDINNLNVVIKPYQIKETIQPVNNYNSGIYSQITITNNKNEVSNLNLYYKINELSESIINNGLKYTITSSNTINGTYSEITTGDFSNIENNELIIKEIEQPANTTTYYRVYLWLDSSIGNQTELENTKLNIELNASSYVISINNKEGGTITTSTNIASFGKTITIFPKAGTNYVYDGATITYLDGTTYMTLNANTVEFVMPSGNIKITPKWKIARSIPEFTYTGSYQIVNDSDTVISNVDTYTGNWKIRFLSSGTLTFTNLNGAENGIDVFLVGGGGNGGVTDYFSASGGGGGYTKTLKTIQVTESANYTIKVGAAAEDTTAFGYTANKGENGGKWGSAGGAGGSGGGGAGNDSGWPGGAGGSNGSDGQGGGNSHNYGNGGKGQGSTTHEFGETGSKLYAGGGGASSADLNGVGSGGSGGGGNGGYNSAGKAGEANTGGGGGGGSPGQYSGGAGGTGIVIIRNARNPIESQNNTIPQFTYTGIYEIVDDNDNYIGSSEGNWKIRFLTSGTLAFESLNGAENGIDVFLVGGGGTGGVTDYFSASGGGGGYTKTLKNIQVTKNASYTIKVGAAAEDTTAFGYTANKGENGGKWGSAGGAGGSGGGGAGNDSGWPGGAGGSNGSDGQGGGNSHNYGNGGKGQGSTTHEFGETGSKLYAGGGGASSADLNGVGAGGSGGGGNGGYNSAGKAGEANTGGGGGGGSPGQYPGGTGGSGIVIIRNKRDPV